MAYVDGAHVETFPAIRKGYTIDAGATVVLGQVFLPFSLSFFYPIALLNLSPLIII